MKSITSLLPNVVMLLLITLSFSCASLPDNSVPQLELRTLRISETFAGFEYSYRVCVKKFLGNCRKTEIHTDTYDLTDLKVRQKLIDVGFVAIVKGPVLAK